jgi:hypothetical protein
MGQKLLNINFIIEKSMKSIGAIGTCALDIIGKPSMINRRY